MRYGSVCSGIEAASVAWHPLGWRPAFFAEVDKFPSAVLGHRYPHVPNRGDMTAYRDWPDDAIDLLVGGTPCQSFSVAGLRKGMADPRGNLALTYLAIADRHRPEWLVWENVPGVLSSNGGRDFGAFLGGLGELGYGFAYRVLDAQYVRVDGFGRAVPQRRRRVFVVGHSGDWRRAAAVLFERESLRWDSTPRRQAGEAVAALTATGVGACGADDNQGQAGHIIAAPVASTLNAHFGDKQGLENQHVNEGCPHVAFMSNASGANLSAAFDHTPTLRVGGDGGNAMAMAFQSSQSGVRHNGVVAGYTVRRLTPTECERLQGFPDGYTAIPYRNKPAADGPRYKALGNSMAVNVMRWIGRRIELVNSIETEIRRAA